MPKFLSFILITLFSLNAIAAEKTLKWLNWNEGYEQSKKNDDKIIMVDVFTDWCGWCKKMDKDTYENEDIVKSLQKKFISIKLNPELEGTYKVDNLEVTGAQLLGMLTQNKQMGYPTILFLFPKTRVVFPMAGYQNATDFKLTLEKMVEYQKTGGKPKQ
jgi:uncharacterized protein YyaL (SSP411 family)